MKIEIQNNKQCFVQLWLELERTRQRFDDECRRFCPRRILFDWFGEEATDDFIWEVCFNTVIDDEQVYGYDLMPPPEEFTVTREFLRAVVATKLGIGMRKVDLRALDAAYSIAFPGSGRNDEKKKHSQEASV